MFKKLTIKKAIKWSILFGVIFLALNSFLPWNHIIKTCVPITNKIGLKSQYQFYKSGLISLMMPKGLDYDAKGSSLLYEISNQQLKEINPDLAKSLRVHARLKDGYYGYDSISGIVTDISEINQNIVNHYRQNFSDTIYREGDNKLFWYETLGGISVSIGKPINNHGHWKRNLGRCDRFPPELDQYNKIQNGPRGCNFTFYGARISYDYSLNAEFAKDYIKFEKILADNLLCKIK